ncbi:hypothetical protein A1OE_1311 [Candidatus Endolissoclinum faulkneri L2]|uniref:Uncharacterized protein n=1 Tax=Candidatus Endolissoclinum faulkneri L2 TaxID=1193729 RepID=K7YSJ1_9PROT|nr:hypothetical protein A1OE_1311 [Candidatus Endolissoclinum faulkneri L2]
MHLILFSLEKNDSDLTYSSLLSIYLFEIILLICDTLSN